MRQQRRRKLAVGCGSASTKRSRFATRVMLSSFTFEDLTPLLAQAIRRISGDTADLVRERQAGEHDEHERPDRREQDGR